MRKAMFVALGLIIFLAPIGLAVIEVDMAETDAYFADPIAYHAHLAPGEASDSLYELLGFRPQEVRADNTAVPRRFLASVPRNLKEIPRVQDRKPLFIATILPLILRVNERVAHDRQRLLRLEKQLERGEALTEEQRQWLLHLAVEYKLDPVESIDELDFARLRRRVDTIPPSLAIAQAAIESAWGTSRFASQGNAIFGQWTWDPADKGIVPKRRPAGRSYRVRAFDYLIDSMRGYIHNLNTAPAYRELRRIRAQLRQRGQPLSGTALAGGLIRYSERGAPYIADLRSIIRANSLDEFDEAELVPRPDTPIG